MLLSEAISIVESMSIADKKVPGMAKRGVKRQGSKEMTMSNAISGPFKDMNGKKGGGRTMDTYFRLPSTGGIYRHFSTNDGDPKYVYGMSVPNSRHNVLFHTSKIEIIYHGPRLKMRGNELMDFLSKQ